MDKSDDYELEFFFSSSANQRREQLKRKFCLLVAIVACILFILLIFDRIKYNNENFKQPPIYSNDASKVDQSLIDQLDLPFINNQQTKGVQKCRQPSYDYLQLAIRWPSSLCLFHHCFTKLDQWIMYSLRPSFYNGTFATTCCDVSDFDTDRVDPLEQLLSNKWPSLFIGVKWKELMRRQFDQYGSCVGSGLTLVEQQRNHTPIATSVPIQLHFIDILRRLAQWLPNIRSNLEQSQLIPQLHADHLYSLNSVAPALKFNRTVGIQCSKYRKGDRKFSLLDTILICFDRFNLQQIDCPNVVDDCQEQIFYPHPNTQFYASSTN